jgi:membrane-associated protein
MEGWTGPLLALLPAWGPWLVAVVTFGSCLGLPLPATVLVLTAGAAAAAGELAVWAVFAAALGGALVGDQAAYALGRAGGRPLVARFARTAERARMVARAEALVARHGLLAVYLSRWPLSPLAPYVCYLAGAARMPRGRFGLASLAGEATWAGLYVGLGFAFAESAAALSQRMGALSSALTGLALAAGLWLAWRTWRRRRAGGGGPPTGERIDKD